MATSTKKPKISRTTMRLSNDTMKKMTKYAREQGFSRTTLIELILREYIQKKENGDASVLS